MKKFLVLFISIISIFGYGQDPEERVINNGDFPVALYSGIPDIKIPLFDLQTKNSNFSPNIALENNLYACTSKYFSTNDIGDGWSLNIKGSITLTGKEVSVNGGPVIIYYDENHFSDQQNDHEGVAVYNYSIMGLQGKFKLVREGAQFQVKIIEQNDYADITLEHTVTDGDFRINSFSIKDKNGFNYVFSDYKEKSIIFINEKTAFYISTISDKNQNNILVFNYSQGTLSSINIVDKGTITLSPPNITKRTIIYNDAASNRNQKVELSLSGGFSPFTKIMLTQVKLFSNDD